MTPRTQLAEVVALRDLGPDVRELVLRPLEHEVSFRAGQWIAVHLALGGEKPVVRAYTLAEPACAEGAMVLCFDRVKGGAASAHLFERRVGDRLTVSDPQGAFVLPPLEGRGVAFVTWLTGVVPMRCMLMELISGEHGSPPPTLLVCGAPSVDALPYHDWLQAFAAEHAWFRYVPVVAPQGAPFDEAARFVLGHLPAAVSEAFPDGAGPATVHPMIVGLKALVLPAREWFVEHLGYTREQVQKETYD